MPAFFARWNYHPLSGTRTSKCHKWKRIEIPMLIVSCKELCYLVSLDHYNPLCAILRTPLNQLTLHEIGKRRISNGLNQRHRISLGERGWLRTTYASYPQPLNLQTRWNDATKASGAKEMTTWLCYIIIIIVIINYYYYFDYYYYYYYYYYYIEL